MKQKFLYDYIIAGAGCAGLSLAYFLNQSAILSQKKILLIDRSISKTHDRTWCFWEKEPSVFDEIVCKSWDTLTFKNNEKELYMNAFPYQYKMIQSIDFYNFITKDIKNNPNIEIIEDEIIELDVVENAGRLKTKNTSYTAKYIFNSTPLFSPKLSKKNTLIQHFMGWYIETQEDVFDPSIARLMDFNIDQKFGTTFMYTLPTSKRNALLEYTLFTPNVLEKQVYKEELRDYLSGKLKIRNYKIVHQEYGEIPMSLQSFPSHYKEKIIHIGTNGGKTKASSGYTFLFTQRHIKEIVECLEKEKKPLIRSSIRSRMFDWYDRTMLEVLISEKMKGVDLFTCIFHQSKLKNLFAFLNNESTLLEDLSIMRNLPFFTFLKAGIKQLYPL